MLNVAIVKGVIRVTSLAWGCAAICFYSVTLVLGAQICHNCGIGSNCSVEFNSSWPIALDTDCWGLCDDSADSNVATFDGTSTCRLYSCSQISQKIGGKTYRKTNHTDCPEYEIYVHTGFEGLCDVMENRTGVSSVDECLELCLETSCLGITYDDTLSLCELHSDVCNVTANAVGRTYIQRICFDAQPACTRNYTQTCVNCRAGLLCQTTFYQMLETKPLDLNTSVIGMDPRVKQIWFVASSSSSMYIQCSYVAQEIGDTVYRASCTQDCPTFEILTLSGHQGTCPKLRSLSGNVTLEFCMDKCLDMVTCRGVTFDKGLQSCSFHACTNYTRSVGNDFMARRCINSDTGCLENSTIIQTCIGCAPGAICPDDYHTTSNTYLYTDCYDIKASDKESVMVHYRRGSNKCMRYQCSKVRQKTGHILYRQSCNTDCRKFEIFKLVDHGGSCEVIQSEEGGLTFDYCIEKCLDINGCRGTTFNSTTGRCDYHSCTHYTASPGVKFMWKHCIDNHLPREHQQTCVGCKSSDICQRWVTSQNTPTWQECQAYFRNSTVTDMYYYNSNTSRCKQKNCTWLQQDEYMNRIAFRLSYSSDCPIFRLFTLEGYVGTCPVIGYAEGGVSRDYCLDKCLDMDGCRAVSHDTEELKCFYHNCTERTQNSNYTFVKRVCITYEELSPIQNYTQTCKNCQNRCHKPLSTQTNQHIAYACNTSCEDCENVIYDPLSDQCSAYQCDRPYALGQGTLMMRKTSNPDCTNFELMARSGSAPNCEAMDYDEGVASVEFCLMRCFDLPGCLSVLIDVDGRNCTYHSCTDYVPDSVLRYLVVKNCLTECSSPVTQICLNCQKGSLCQSSFANTTSVTRDSCKAECETQPFCEGAVYNSNSSECKLYQCSYVAQLYGSTLYRDSCNNDCPLYEVYILDGYAGSCQVIDAMTEYLVLYPEICYQRCLDTVNCRGVTYLSSKLECYYHDCNCHVQYTALPATFWWRYCLDDVSEVTVLPQTNSSLNGADIYPTIPECNPTTNSSSNTSTSSINSSLTTTTVTVSPTQAIGNSSTNFSSNSSLTSCKPAPIYMMPCLCSTGAFANMTNEEIIQHLIKNLTIDAASTSANLRRYSSAKDKRPSAAAVGSVGVAILISVTVTLVAMDAAHFIRMSRSIYRKLSKMSQQTKKANTKRQSLSENASFDSIESLQHYYAQDCLCTGEAQNSSHSEKQFAIELIQ